MSARKDLVKQLGRHSILIEIKPDHVKMAERRTAQGGLLLGATE